MRLQTIGFGVWWISGGKRSYNSALVEGIEKGIKITTRTVNKVYYEIEIPGISQEKFNQLLEVMMRLQFHLMWQY